MTSDKYDILGPIFAAIGEECAAIVGGDPDGLYLYGVAGEGHSGGGIFLDEGDAVRYYRLSPELFALILKAWETDGKDQKWALMEYEIKGTSFDAKLIYPDEIDQGLSVSELREIYLKRHFGDKEVIYPPLPDWIKEAMKQRN
jgi:hypothetical protein